eukprot:COSAG01_NODE_15375_length_1344_cov_1.463082_2_plen_84_part_00
MRPLDGGDVAVALVNTGTATADITVQLSAVVCATCQRRATVVDVWGGDELGSWGPVSNSMHAQLGVLSYPPSFQSAAADTAAQ